MRFFDAKGPRDHDRGKWKLGGGGLEVEVADHWEVEGQGADHLNQHQGGGEGRTMTGSLKTPCASI